MVTTEFRIFTIDIINVFFVTNIVISKVIAGTFNILAITIIVSSIELFVLTLTSPSFSLQQ